MGWVIGDGCRAARIGWGLGELVLVIDCASSFLARSFRGFWALEVQASAMY